MRSEATAAGLEWAVMVAHQFGETQADQQPEFSIGLWSGDNWQIGFCRLDEFDIWRGR
jgi:hypothetical protein